MPNNFNTRIVNVKHCVETIRWYREAERQPPTTGQPATPFYPHPGDQGGQHVARNDPGPRPRYPAVPLRLRTDGEYHRMGEAGLLTEEDRVEPIEGELVTIFA